MSSYVQRVREFTDDYLDAEANRMVGVEKVHMACVIAHLAEIARRKLHLVFAHSMNLG